MKQILKAVDAEIFTAQSGNEALSQMLRNDFAVVFLDVQMPEMDGFEMAALMRENEQTMHIPIIFVTAISKEEKYVFEGYESGAVDYLFKPLSANVLQSKARVFCQLYYQRKDLETEVERRKRMETKNEELIRELQKALDDIKTLRGIIPICSHCKKIRDSEGYWKEVEVYVQNHSEAEFTHSLCIECMKKLYPEEAAEFLRESENKKSKG